ncbi:MAG: SMI1/KNR4 family protein [Phycisphaerae bacterium]|jgi:hypothetical protein
MIDFKPDTSAPPPGLRTLAQLEEDLGLMLPEEYVALLRQSNGGVPVCGCFECDGQERLVERFLCILDTPEEDEAHGPYDVSVVWSQVGERLVDDPALVGTNVLPIAALSAGDLVCLDFREDPATPAVVVWDHEQSAELHPRLVRVADSLLDFLRMLRP